MLVWWAMADGVNNAVTAYPLAAQSRLDTRHDRLAREITELFEQWRPGMFRYLASLGLTTHDSEEVIQETFLALFSHLQKEKARTNLRGWLFRVAHNLGVKHQLAARKSAALDTGPDLPHPALNPEEQLARTRRERQIISVLSALPERDRRCLFLRAEGLRYREIAGVLGVSLGTVAGSLERALARLQRACQR
jgi:RNA polymerase sigma-70 factor (ECF subfamily)